MSGLSDADPPYSAPTSPPAGEPPSAPRRRRRAKWIFAATALLLLVAVAMVLRGAWVDPETPVPATHVEVGDAGPRQGTMDEALQLAEESLAHLHANVVDYVGRVRKRERVGGVLVDGSEMEFKIQTRAHDEQGNRLRAMRVYLHFLRPADTAGREVIWGEDLNDGKLIVHQGPGFASRVLGRISLDPHGFLARQGSRYPITELGVTRLTELLIERGMAARQDPNLQVRFFDDHQLDGRDALLLQVHHPQEHPHAAFHLAEISIDREWQIPLRYASYGFPDSEEDEPPLLEEFVYLDVQLNVGLTDADFDPDNPGYNFP